MFGATAGQCLNADPWIEGQFRVQQQSTFAEVR